MAAEEVGPNGKRDGVVVPFFALIPLRPQLLFWLIYERVVFAVVRVFQRWFFRKVQRLGTVHAMRWMLVPPFSPLTRAGRRVDRNQHLLFESNYSGDGPAYVESFAITLKPGMSAIFGPTLGYPGLEDPKAFTKFALSYNREPEIYYVANPGADTVRVQQALLCYRRGKRPSEMQEPEFIPGRPITVRWRTQSRSPRWAAVILPVRSDRVTELRLLLRAHRKEGAVGIDGTDGYPFKSLSRMHFARLTLIDDPAATYLILTATFDAVRRYRRRTGPIPHRFRSVRPAEIALGELVAENFGALDAILQYCDGYTSAGLPDLRTSMLRYLLAHQKDARKSRVLPYCAYPEATVGEIRTALRWMDSFTQAPEPQPEQAAT
jgi:hypothetical protein